MRLILERPDGHCGEVQWTHPWRPWRYQHTDGLTYDQSGQRADGAWIYRSTQTGKPVPTAKVHLESEHGAYVAAFDMLAPDEYVEWQGHRYKFQHRHQDGGGIYRRVVKRKAKR